MADSYLSLTDMRTTCLRASFIFPLAQSSPAERKRWAPRVMVSATATSGSRPSLTQSSNPQLKNPPDKTGCLGVSRLHTNPIPALMHLTTPPRLTSEGVNDLPRHHSTIRGWRTKDAFAVRRGASPPPPRFPTFQC